MGRGGRKKRSKAGQRWWSKLTSEQRAAVKRQQRAGADHHFLPDVACPPCGTDSTTGCVAVRPDA